MGNDLNSAQALTVLYDVLKSELNDAEKRYLIAEFDKVLSLSLLKETESVASEDDEEIEQLVKQRTQARAERNWALADQIRDELKARNIIIEDTPDGVKWKRG